MGTDATISTPALVRHRLAWRHVSVKESIEENPSTRTLVLDIPGWQGHHAGQHVDIRLTADDGYQATRSYSLSSGPGESPQITVGRVEAGEVSTFLVDDIQVGDQFELRGPIGGVFVWNPTGAPLYLIAGGTGLAPLRAMWRAGADGAPIEVRCSFRCADQVLFKTEITRLGGTIHLSRGEPAPGFAGGRIDLGSIQEGLARLGGAAGQPAVFVCGPTRFVEPMISLLDAAGVDRRSIRAERFG